MTKTSTVPTRHDLLELVNKKFGFVPNVLREMSVSPAALQVYLKGQDALAHGSLSPKEQQAVQLAVAAANSCDYCQAAHGWIGRAVGISPEDVRAIQTGSLPEDAELGTIVDVTRHIITKKGWLDDADLQAVERQGVTRAKLYEIVAYIGLKTISNYINHMAHTPTDEQFKTSC